MNQFYGYANYHPPYGYSPPPWQPPVPYQPQPPLQHFSPPEPPKQREQEKTEIAQIIEFPTMNSKSSSLSDFINRLKIQWTVEELNFSMNRISMAGLIIGLMFLGSIFFLLGFLVAVNLYTGKTSPQPQQRLYIPTEGAVISGRVGAQPLAQQPQPRMPIAAQQYDQMQHPIRMPSFQPR